MSPSGNEIGPFRALEEGMLASLSAGQDMSSIFAWHVVAGTLGVSAGTFSAGWIMAALQKLLGWSEQLSYRGIFVAYAIIGTAKLIVALCLSDASELEPRRKHTTSVDSEESQSMLQSEATVTKDRSIHGVVRRLLSAFIPSISPSTRSVLWKLCLLFAVDSFASGIVAL